MFNSVFTRFIQYSQKFNNPIHRKETTFIIPRQASSGVGIDQSVLITTVNIVNNEFIFYLTTKNEITKPKFFYIRDQARIKPCNLQKKKRQQTILFLSLPPLSLSLKTIEGERRRRREEEINTQVFCFVSLISDQCILFITLKKMYLVGFYPPFYFRRKQFSNLYFLSEIIR